jgi:hypothetical protein
MAFAGFRLGLCVSGDGSGFSQFLVSTFPIALLGWAIPRGWRLPSGGYAVGFHAGLNVLEGFGQQIQAVLNISFVILTGSKSVFQSLSPPPDSAWICVVAALVGFCCAAMRLSLTTKSLGDESEALGAA